MKTEYTNRPRLRRCGAVAAILAAVVCIGVGVGFAMDGSANAPSAPEAAVPAAVADTVAAPAPKPVRKVLFIGDSMTGWMAERLNAYGNANGFEVATVVWDGSTIAKWGNNAKRLRQIVGETEPDAVFVSLGMNELFERNPSRLAPSIDAVVDAVGDRGLLWIGPPSWPGHEEGAKLTAYLRSHLGDGRYFDSFALSLPRQSSSNPHPTREGIIKWMDAVAAWVPGHTGLNFESLDAPSGSAMSRGKTFIYRRMKESL